MRGMIQDRLSHQHRVAKNPANSELFPAYGPFEDEHNDPEAHLDMFETFYNNVCVGTER